MGEAPQSGTATPSRSISPRTRAEPPRRAAAIPSPVVTSPGRSSPRRRISSAKTSTFGRASPAGVATGEVLYSTMEP